MQSTLEHLSEPVASRLQADEIGVIEIMVLEQLVRQPVNNTLEKRFIHEDL